MTETNTAELAAVKAASLAKLSIKDTVLAQFRETEEVLTALADRYRNVVYDVTTSKGMKEAIAARADLRDNGRLFVTRAETRIKGEVNELKRVMSTEVERLVEIVKPVEDSIGAQIKAEEDRKAAEKAERERIEAERVARHRAYIAKIKSYVERAVGQPVEAIEQAVSVLSGLTIGESCEEFQDEARAALAATIESLRAMANAERKRIQDEANTKALADELAAARAELEALRAKEAKGVEGVLAKRAETASQDASKTYVVNTQPDPAPETHDDPGVDEDFPEIPLASNDAGSVDVCASNIKTITVEMLSVTDINKLLAPMSVTSAGLSELGIEHAATDRNAKLYKATDFERICLTLIHRLQLAMAKQKKGE